MLPEIRDWYYKLCKGWIESFVRGGKGVPTRIIKSIQTVLSQGNLERSDLNQMLVEVEYDTQAFVRTGWSDPAGRLGRLGAIRSALA